MFGWPAEVGYFLYGVHNFLRFGLGMLINEILDEGSLTNLKNVIYERPQEGDPINRLQSEIISTIRTTKNFLQF